MQATKMFGRKRSVKYKKNSLRFLKLCRFWIFSKAEIWIQPLQKSSDIPVMFLHETINQTYFLTDRYLNILELNWIPSGVYLLQCTCIENAFTVLGLIVGSILLLLPPPRLVSVYLHTLSFFFLAVCYYMSMRYVQVEEEVGGKYAFEININNQFVF